MLNQIILVGRLTRNITVNKSESGVEVATISIAVPRSFKNVEGVYVLLLLLYILHLLSY